MAHAELYVIEEVGTLTSSEVTRLVRACSKRSSTGLRNRALITVLYRGGFRVSEALHLVEADLDRLSRVIRHTRRGRSRAVGLDPGAFQILERWVERRREISLPFAAPLFCTLRGDEMRTSYVRALFARLAQAARIEKRVSAEILRRTLAAELAREGFPVSVIQAHLGHANASTTSRYLAALARPEALVAAAQAMQRRGEWRP